FDPPSPIAIPGSDWWFLNETLGLAHRSGPVSALVVDWLASSVKLLQDHDL
ncbi:unnamed protein product, partial [Musa acuminata subsp. burmannicoides]